MTAPRTSTETFRTIRTAVLGAALIAIVGGMAAAPAYADDDGWHHGWHQRHERHEHEWREHQRPYAYVVPGYPRYVYAPPPVIYAPPPVIYAPPPLPAIANFDIIFPIHLR